MSGGGHGGDAESRAGERLAAPPDALLAGAEGAEVLGRLWADRGEELELDPPRVDPSDLEIEVDAWVGRRHRVLHQQLRAAPSSSAASAASADARDAVREGVDGEAKAAEAEQQQRQRRARKP